MSLAVAAVRCLSAAVVHTTRGWQRYLASSCDASSCVRPGDDGGPSRIVFFGTPQVSALVLGELLRAAAMPGSNFEVAAVVSRPSGKHWLRRSAAAAEASGCPPASQPASSASGSPPRPAPTVTAPAAAAPNWSRHGASAVERLARESGLPSERILCPISPKEPEFLEAMRSLRPALAVTAAYGAILPQTFLDIPQIGTINIHPSLLPRYRGAAPVQRSLQDGCSVGGVSLVFTVMKCDAGPILEQQQVPIPPDIQAPEFTEQMFQLGAQMLVRQLPRLLSGEVSLAEATPQDEAAATYAHKIERHEAKLDFRQSAAACHNHVRAMAGWPLARASLLVEKSRGGPLEPLELKVLRSRVAPPPPEHGLVAAGAMPPGAAAQVVCSAASGELLVRCGDGDMLQILEVGRRSTGLGAKSLTAKEFVTGLSKRRLFLPHTP